MRFLLFFCLVVLMLMSTFSLSGCASWTKPDRKDFSSDQCYMAALCGWENANNEETDTDRDCSGYDDECRAFDKYIFCGCEKPAIDEEGNVVKNEDGTVKIKTNRWKVHDEEDCWKTLNQK